MRHGTKKIRTRVPGHQNCSDCHPPQKAHQARARRGDRREIDRQLDGRVAWEPLLVGVALKMK